MKQNLAIWFWYFSIAWGVISLGVGALASSSIGANDTVFTVLAFALLFVLPIAASIAARWLPIIAGVALLVSISVILVVACHSLADVLQVLKRPYLWFHLMFGIGFVFLAEKIRKPWRTDPALDGYPATRNKS